MLPTPGTLLERPPRRRTPPGLLDEARYVVLPDGIVSSAWPSAQATCAAIGMTLDRWQAELARCILAKGLDGLYAADTVVISIPRQVGKTYLIGALVFADCIINPGTTVVWTAHRFKVARETFNELKGVATSPALAPHIDENDITTAAGNESIVFRNGSRIVFAARERGAIRGFSKVRRIILDEAQILTEAAMSDLAPTMNQAENPQLILMGTPPKPTDPGESFTNLREEALEGRSEGVVYVEFSAPEDCDIDDREAWAIANPSLHKRTPVKAIERLRKLFSDEDDFRREALGIWDSVGGSGPINAIEWAALGDPDAARGSEVVFGIAVAPDRSWSAIAAAWRRPDGQVQVCLTVDDDALVDHRRSTEWVKGRVRRLQRKWGGTVLATTAARGVVPDATEPAATAQTQAHTALADLVKAGGVRHGNQRELNAAVKAARWRPTGDTQAFDRKGDADITPLDAAALAVHGVRNPARKRPGTFMSI